MPPEWAYFDTSVLVKRYIREQGSLQARALLRRYSMVSSSIINPEVISAFCRRRRLGELSEVRFSMVINRVHADRRHWKLIEVSSSVLRSAERLLQGSVPMKTLDAIHIASLIAFNAATADDASMITADARQGDAARQVGLNVVWVG